MKDLSVQFMTFCDYATVSQENKLSIIGIFDQIRLAQLPGGIASAYLVALVKGKPDAVYHVSMQGMKGSKTIFQPIKLEVRMSPMGGSNVTINITNFNFQEEGEYQFSIMHEKKEIGHTSLKVINVNKSNVPEPIRYKLPN